jgi:hypothetical protein
MSLETLSCLDATSIPNVSRFNIHEAHLEYDPYTRILSESFRSRVKRAEGVVQILVHPYFAEYDDEIELQKLSQYYYAYKREKVLDGLQALQERSLPTVSLVAEDELMPQHIFSLLAKQTVLIPTPSAHPVPDVDKAIRMTASKMDFILSGSQYSSTHGFTSDIFDEYTHGQKNLTEDEQFAQCYQSIDHERETLVTRSWNTFAHVLKEAGVKRAVLRGKVMYVSNRGRNVDGCVPEVNKQLDLRSIPSHYSRVLYVQHCR